MADDLVMESTTDSPEQIAEGLGIDAPAAAADPVEGDASVEASEAEGDEAEEPEAEVAPVGEVTAHPHRAVASRKAKPAASRPQPKGVAGAAAAARRTAEARTKVAETERDAALARVAELTAGRPAAQPTAAAVAREAAAVVTADQVPDTHPEVAAVLAKLSALGPKPKQEDFTDYAEFDAKKDTWIEDRAVLRNRAESVREDVARRSTIQNDEANRAALATKTRYETSLTAAKARHADYDEVMEVAEGQGLIVTRDMGMAMMESEIGADVAYYLASHPAEIARIKALSPHRQIAEVGILEGRIAASIKGKGPVVPERKVARTTQAPDPQTMILGDLPSGSKTRDEEMNDPRTSQARYNQLRNQMDVESGRRTH